MNRASSNGGTSRPLFTPIRLEDFEVTWAGPNPLQPGFCFGSEDGRLLFTDERGIPLLGPGKGSDSGEAINGVAYSGGWIAVSTRAGIMMGAFPQNGKNQRGHIRFPWGAHGVAASPGGNFVAPLGRAGVMFVKAGSGVGDPVSSLTSDKEGMYFYRVVALRGRDGSDLLACACRQGGISTTEVGWGQETYNMRVSATKGLDVVDVCAVASDADSPAVAALGRDGTLILVRDALRDRNPAAIKFNTIRGTAFRLLSGGGHLFVLTSRGLYVLTKLAERLVAGIPPGEFTTQIVVVPLETVDASLVDDRWLLVITPDEVLKLDVGVIGQRALGDPDWDEGDVEEELSTTATPDWEIREISQTSRQLAATS
jgi:hypothetical protein